MCMGYGSLPVGADVIADLEVGDEITIKKGFGRPAAEDDTTDVIVGVDGFSALTASGVMLMCDDGYGVEPTDRHLEEGEYEISEKAHEIMEEARLQMAMRELKDAGFVEEMRPNYFRQN